MTSYSRNQEDLFIRELLYERGIYNPVVWDIGCGHPGDCSNSRLFIETGSPALLVDADPNKTNEWRRQFPRTVAVPQQVTPTYFTEPSLPVDFLSLDIDSWDLSILRAILGLGHLPTVIVHEYNPVFRPGLYFEVPYHPGHKWNGSPVFGASIDAFDDLLTHKYTLIKIFRDNAVWLRQSRFPTPAPSLKDAYREGFLENGPEHFLWQRQILAECPTDNALVARIQQEFPKLNPNVSFILRRV